MKKYSFIRRHEDKDNCYELLMKNLYIPKDNEENFGEVDTREELVELMDKQDRCTEWEIGMKYADILFSEVE